jgi:hypothetical protein
MTKIQSERHMVCMYMITKMRRTTGTKNYGPLVSNVIVAKPILRFWICILDTADSAI